jgi:hypothetical protein
MINISGRCHAATSIQRYAKFFKVAATRAKVASTQAQAQRQRQRQRIFSIQL